MRRRFAVLGLALAGAALAATFAVVPAETTQAAPGQATFVVPANDGYGIGGDCSAAGSSCGRVVADAWCEAQGFARSASFGASDTVEVTGSIGTPAGRPISITCTQ